MTKIKVTFISSVTQLKPSIMLPEPIEVQEAQAQQRRGI